MSETVLVLMNPQLDELNLVEFDWAGSFRPDTVKRLWQRSKTIDVGLCAKAAQANASKTTRSMLRHAKANIESHIKMYLNLLRVADGSEQGLICYCG